jgi:hypothetical protein
MKKIIISLLVVIGFVSVANAKDCREGAYDVCSFDRYQIVEVEPVTYWPHNQMASAHIFKKKRKVRYRRVRVARSLFSCSR